MNVRICIVTCIAIAYAVVAMTVPRAVPVLAQATEEPTKRPYVFPTPIYIPPFADDTPAPRATPMAPLQPGADTYTVQAGDSPWLIAQKVYGDGTKYKLILEANNLPSDARLRVGAVLKIPGGNPAPTAAPTSASVNTTPIAPASTASANDSAPTPLATAVTFATTPTPIPASASSASNADWLTPLVYIVSATLLIASILTGTFAYLMFLRTRRIERLASGKQPIRIKQ